MSTLEGKLVANNMKVGIVVARFNVLPSGSYCCYTLHMDFSESS